MSKSVAVQVGKEQSNTKCKDNSVTVLHCLRPWGPLVSLDLDGAMTDEIDPVDPFHALGRPELDVVVNRDCKGVGTSPTSASDLVE